VAAPSLEGFKARLDGALSTLGWWKMSLLVAGWLEPDDLQGPFQPKPFYNSMTAVVDSQRLPGDEGQQQWILRGFLGLRDSSNGFLEASWAEGQQRWILRGFLGLRDSSDGFLEASWVPGAEGSGGGCSGASWAPVAEGQQWWILRAFLGLWG